MVEKIETNTKIHYFTWKKFRWKNRGECHQLDPIGTQEMAKLQPFNETEISQSEAFTLNFQSERQIMIHSKGPSEQILPKRVKAQEKCNQALTITWTGKKLEMTWPPKFTSKRITLIIHFSKESSEGDLQSRLQWKLKMQSRHSQNGVICTVF